MRIKNNSEEAYSRNLMAPSMEAGTVAQSKKEKAGKKDENQIKNGRIFAGNLAITDPVSAKKKEAQKKALKIVKDAFQKELEIDDSVGSLKDSAKEAEKEMFSLQEKKKRIAARREEIAADQTMTEEERKAAKLELDKAEEFLNRQQRNQSGVREGALSSVKGIALSRLKSAPILDASKSAEKVLKNAEKEVVSMLYGEAKEHLDAEQDRKYAETKEKEEKEKEIKERIEAMKAEKKEEKEENTQEVSGISSRTEQILRQSKVKEDVQKEIQGVAKQMKLSLEDLKGAAVDEEV